MEPKYKKFLILLAIVILAGGAYLYISNNSKKQPALNSSSLSSSNNQNDTNTTDNNQTVDNKVASDISFLNTLISLKSINIDTTLFSSNTFNSLKNNTVNIGSAIPGRPNPFAPIELSNGGIVVSNVVTDQPTQVTDKSAVLNGTINITSGVTGVYFEYGTTEQSLSTITPMVKQSLVGTFIKSIVGLTPKTIYFSRACAKVNNAPICGKIISFTTN